MAKKLYTESYISAIADAIRDKLGTTDTMKVSEMADNIEAISGGDSRFEVSELTFATDTEVNGASIDLPFETEPDWVIILTTNNVGNWVANEALLVPFHYTAENAGALLRGGNANRATYRTFSCTVADDTVTMTCSYTVNFLSTVTYEIIGIKF